MKLKGYLICLVDAADGLDGEDLPAVHDEVQLEDFFWTGSGDGPPDYLKRVHTGLSRGRDMVVKTETVVATVYVDGNNVSLSLRRPRYKQCLTLTFPNARRSMYRFVWIVMVAMMVMVAIGMIQCWVLVMELINYP